MTRDDILLKLYEQKLSVEDAEVALARQRLPPLEHLQPREQAARPVATFVFLLLFFGLLLLMAAPALFFLLFFGMMA